MIAAFMPNACRRGRPRTTALRAVTDAIFYIAQTGCQWRLLPKEFPPYTTVQRYFYRWRDDGTWQKINQHLVMLAREAEGREANPTAGVIDSQSVKTTEAGGPRGFDAGKQIKGRKRHLLTDTAGILIAGIVHEASIQDRDGAPALLALIRSAFPWLRHIFADGGYAGNKLRNALAALGHWTIEIIKRSDAIKGFTLLPRRLGGRTHHRLAEPQSSPRKGFRGHNRERRNVADNRQRQAALTQARQSTIVSRQIMSQTLSAATKVSRAGSLHYVFEDWRHIADLIEVGRSVYSEMVNIAVWAKSTAGQGSFYRSQHEMIAYLGWGRAASQQHRTRAAWPLAIQSLQYPAATRSARTGWPSCRCIRPSSLFSWWETLFAIAPAGVIECSTYSPARARQSWRLKGSAAAAMPSNWNQNISTSPSVAGKPSQAETPSMRRPAKPLMR